MNNIQNDNHHYHHQEEEDDEHERFKEEEEEALTVSAPGKALIAGGYLILERPNVGIILAADKHFHCTIMSRLPLDRHDDDNDDEDEDEDDDTDKADSVHRANYQGMERCPIDVYSPQFNTTYSYTLYYDVESTTATFPSSSGGGSSSSKKKMMGDPFTNSKVARGKNDDNDEDNDAVILRLVRLRNQTEKYSTAITKNAFVERTLLLTLTLIYEMLGSQCFHELIQLETLVIDHEEVNHDNVDETATENMSTKRSNKTAKKKKKKAISIQLRADNDFYSPLPHLSRRQLDVTPMNVQQLPPFLPCHTSNHDDDDDDNKKLLVHKTGLGSSAALTSSLVGALLSFFNIVHLPNPSSPKLQYYEEEEGRAEEKAQEEHGLRMVHNLSQLCHCSAQHKIGSGFDVSSAVFGSQSYVRFSKSEYTEQLLEHIDKQVFFGDGNNSHNTKGKADDAIGGVYKVTKSIAQGVCRCVRDDENGDKMALEEHRRNNADGGRGKKVWDGIVRPLHLPSGLELMMADVCGGSESPSMARKVLEWKKRNDSKKQSDGKGDYWERLREVNGTIEKILADAMSSSTNGKFQKALHKYGEGALSKLTAEGWSKLVTTASSSTRNHDDDDDGLKYAASKLLELRNAFVEARANLKNMGIAAGVPIEPDEQSALADATMDIPGVVAAGVPGAGGYDALFVIYVKGAKTCTSDSMSGGRRGNENDDKNQIWSDEVRDIIGNLWRTWGENQDGGTRVCPLAVRSAGFGGLHGICETNLGW